MENEPNMAKAINFPIKWVSSLKKNLAQVNLYSKLKIAYGGNA